MTSTANELRQLNALLAEECEAVEALLAAARDKRQAILAQDRNGIEDAVAEETKLIERVGSLEDARAAWLRAWVANGDTPSVETLSDVLEVLAEKSERGPIAEELKATADRLAQAVEELDDVNRENAGLLYHSIAYVQNLLNVLQGEEARDSRYGPGASRPKAKQEQPLKEWRA